MKQFNNVTIGKLFFALLSIFLVIFSFSQTIYQYVNRGNVAEGKEAVIEHNYTYDYNFYLSRIREGQEGHWTVVEKYTAEPHSGSLLQVFYLYMGKLGGMIGLTPPVIYNVLRAILGFSLLYLISLYISDIFKTRKLWMQVMIFLLVVTASSWPSAVVWVKGWPRFGNYMSWWSAIDTFQRITFIPHILLGQLGILFFVWKLGNLTNKSNWTNWMLWGVGGFILGIIFPSAVITLYAIFFVLSVFEIVLNHSDSVKAENQRTLIPRIIFFLFSIPSLLYIQLITKIYPWKKLVEFDLIHPLPFNFNEYLKALGPLLILGILGMFVVLLKREKKLFPMVSWVLGLGLLFKVFSYIPAQSPLRFTESAMHIPLGILAGYLTIQFWAFSKRLKWSIRLPLYILTGLLALFPIIMGINFMISTRLWLIEQADQRIIASYPAVPDGVYLANPTAEFMDGMRFLRDHTDKNYVVLGYIATGNFIPAYAGNTVFMGHANTPFLERKITEAERFYAGNNPDAEFWLRNNNISLVFYGPVEREWGKVEDLSTFYPFFKEIYKNSTVRIYRAL